MINNPTTAFLVFLDHIFNTPIQNEESLNDRVLEAIAIYREGWRHNYSSVTAYILRNINVNDLRQFIGQSIEQLDSILELITESIQVREKQVDQPQLQDYKLCFQGLIRLKDHIALELLRLDYSKSLENRLIELNKLAHKKLNELDQFVHETSEKSNEMKGQIQTASKQFSKLSNDLKIQRTEAITILGIFSSIIGVLVAGVGLSSAIFANMDDVTSWLLCGLSCLIVMFISNTLFQLFNFLREIADRPAKSSTLLWCFNLVMSVIVVYCLYMNFYFF